ncbi:hypothetical protein L208DRAFT_1256564, partial [Tricholoma matsutake]
CKCGSPVGKAEIDVKMNIIQCKKSDCETRWYHLECISLERAMGSWVCQACKGGDT